MTERERCRGRAYAGRMSLDKAQMMRLLRDEGAKPIDLMRAFGSSMSTTEHILAGRRWQGKPCKGCWRRVGEKANGNGYCEACQEQTCQRCRGPKSPGRKSARCATCDREAYVQVSVSHRTCRDCGEELPPERRDRLCSDCRHREYEFQKEKRGRLNPHKTCSQPACENPLPAAPSWNRSLCADCAKKHDRLRRALSRRYCGLCGKERKGKNALAKTGYCNECRRDLRTVDQNRRKEQTKEEFMQEVARGERRKRVLPGDPQAEAAD